jgi:uncharacterized protein (DUF934 family)
MSQFQRIKLLVPKAHAEDSRAHVITLANDADPLEERDAIAQAERVELHFPQFTDGRAYSQAYLIRRRLGFKGDLRATGEVLVDQLIQLERTGFSSAVLQEGVDAADAQRHLDRFPAFYQGDTLRAAPFLQSETADKVK